MKHRIDSKNHKDIIFYFDLALVISSVLSSILIVLLFTFSSAESLSWAWAFGIVVIDFIVEISLFIIDFELRAKRAKEDNDILHSLQMEIYMLKTRKEKEDGKKN